MGHQNLTDGTLSVVCWLVVVSCFISVVRSRSAHSAFAELSENRKINSGIALYLCSLGSYILGFIYTSIAIVLFFLNPTNLSMSECYPANILPAVWVLNKMFVHLFFVARIKLSFADTSLALSSVKTRFLVGSIVAINLGIVMFVLTSITVYIEVGYSNKTRESIHDVYSCWEATENIRHELIGRIFAMPLVIFDFIFALIELRLYVRRLWHLVENSSPAVDPSVAISMSKPDNNISDNNNTKTANGDEIEESIASINAANFPTLKLPRMSLTLGTSSVSGDDTMTDPRPSLTHSTQSSSDFTSSRRQNSWSALSTGSRFIMGFSPMMSRMRTIVEGDPSNQSFVRLATRTTTLALIAIISSCLGVLATFITSHLLAAIDIAVNALCVYFCFGISSRSVLNPCCVRCFECTDKSIMPCFYVCCEFECCECHVFDCDHYALESPKSDTNDIIKSDVIR